jgi:hypothetical protein
MAKKKKTNPSRGRVKNATKNIYKGIEFKSKLERYCYEQLTKNDIKAEYEKEKITLIEPFKYKGKSIRATTYNPDFIGDNFIIECKGYFTEVARLKWKLFLRWMNENRPDYDVYMPKSIKQVDEVVNEIKNKLNEV